MNVWTVAKWDYFNINSLLSYICCIWEHNHLCCVLVPEHERVKAINKVVHTPETLLPQLLIYCAVIIFRVKQPFTITNCGNKTEIILTCKGYKDTVTWSPVGNAAMSHDKFIQRTPVAILSTSWHSPDSLTMSSVRSKVLNITDTISSSIEECSKLWLRWYFWKFIMFNAANW